MAKDGTAAKPHGEAVLDVEDVRSLLSGHSSDGDESMVIKTKRSRRQSSLAQFRPNGLPRTVNHVRFEVGDDEAAGRQTPPIAENWEDEEDSRAQNASDSFDEGDRFNQSLPLLTSIEAPTVVLASGNGNLNPHSPLEDAGPKSGLRSAFMNMANSIM